MTIRKWASSTNYPVAGKSWDSTPTKVEPLGLTAYGFTPDTRLGAQSLNSLMASLFDACYDPTQGVEAIKTVNRASLGSYVPAYDHSICFVPELGLYRYYDGATAAAVEDLVVATASGRWFWAGQDFRGGPNGVASLDADALVPRNQLPGKLLVAQENLSQAQLGGADVQFTNGSFTDIGVGITPSGHSAASGDKLHYSVSFECTGSTAATAEFKLYYGADLCQPAKVYLAGAYDFATVTLSSVISYTSGGITMYAKTSAGTITMNPINGTLLVFR